ncbi:hypothetical protein NPIL_682601, partial [Nephila pilipes]
MVSTCKRVGSKGRGRESKYSKVICKNSSPIVTDGQNGLKEWFSENHEGNHRLVTESVFQLLGEKKGCGIPPYSLPNDTGNCHSVSHHCFRRFQQLSKTASDSQEDISCL